MTGFLGVRLRVFGGLAEEADHQVFVDEGGADFEGSRLCAVDGEAELEVEAQGGLLGGGDAEEDLLEGGVVGGAIEEGGEEGSGEAATAAGGSEEDADEMTFVALFALVAAEEGGDADEVGLRAGGSAKEEAHGEVGLN